MSDPDSDDNKPPETPSTVKPAAQSKPTAKAPLEKKAGSGKGVAWLALLLVIALGLAAGWVVREGQYRQEALVKRLADLEVATGREQANLGQVEERWRGEWRSALGDLQSALGLGNLRTD